MVLRLGDPLRIGAERFQPRPRRRACHRPVVVTTSVHVRAVRSFCPIGAGARGSFDHLPDRLPTYGAIAPWAWGPGIQVVDDDLRAVDPPYDLGPGVVHDLRGDNVIRDSTGDGCAQRHYQAALRAHRLAGRVGRWEPLSSTAGLQDGVLGLEQCLRCRRTGRIHPRYWPDTAIERHTG